MWRSTPSLPSLNALYHLRIWDEDKTASPISCPQQLQRFGTRFSEFHAELDRVTLLQTPLHFRPWQDTKTTTHFPNVLTATKALTQLRKVQLHTWVPPPPPNTPTILSWPFWAAQKNHSHYFWDRPRMCCGTVDSDEVRYRHLAWISPWNESKWSPISKCNPSMGKAVAWRRLCHT